MMTIADVSSRLRLFTPAATIFIASTSRPLSVSSRIASTGSSMAIWKTSFLFFSPPENPTFTSLFAKSLFICTSCIFSFMSLRNSLPVRGWSPLASRCAFTAAFMKLALDTPGISTGYWKLRKMPSRLLSSGDIARRPLPLKVISPSVTS